EEERSPCTTTRNRQCQCKPGTFRGEDSPEFCRKCRTRCPDGMVEYRPCTPRSDLVCVPKGSGTKASGEAPASGQAVTTSQANCTSPLPSSGNGLLVMQIVFWAMGVLLLVVVVVTLLCWRHNCSDCDQDLKCVDRVFSWCWSSPRGPRAEDNARNKILNNRDSGSTVVSEQEMESQEPAELIGVTILSPGEAEHLLGPTEAEGSQRRRLLVPANGADPID
ncbi:tumor necrosis factor receptor superfamily member 10D precursor, partial [Daubentonia madagascariensis]